MGLAAGLVTPVICFARKVTLNALNAVFIGKSNLFISPIIWRIIPLTLLYSRTL